MTPSMFFFIPFAVSGRTVRVLPGSSLAISLHARGFGRVRVARLQVLPQAVHVGRDEPVGLVGRATLLLPGEALGCSGLGAGGLAQPPCHRRV